MDTRLSNRLLHAIEVGELELKVVPFVSPLDPVATDLYQIVLTIGDDAVAQVGVWKTAAGGVEGNGGPQVRAVGMVVEVAAGDGMDGSFEIGCSCENEAEELAEVLRDRFIQLYDDIEVDIASSV